MIDETEYKNQLFDNVMMTTWDLNSRTAHVVTKKNHSPFSTNLEVLLASAANPKYFKPVVKDNAAFIGGDAVAVSPALLAFMQATDISKKDAKNVEVFSIGSIYERADRIPADVGLSQWATRVDSLTGLSKKQTQDYLLNKILEKYGTNLKKYHYPISSTDSETILELDEPFIELKHMANDFINENQMDIDEDLTALVKERFSIKYACPPPV